MRFTIFHESRRGARRHNQDRIACTHGRDTLLLVVADGMGGHARGDVAAQICVQLFVEAFQREAKPVLGNPPRFLRDAMQDGHRALLSYASQLSLAETPRTTCVACVVQGGHACWAHAGDSRLYLFRRGRLLAATRDHSKVQYLVDHGVIGPREAATHPERNRVLSCLGGVAEPTIALGPRTPLEDGDLVVLCTDGFWSTVAPEEIAGVLASTPVLQAGPALLDAAVRRGGAEGDNASAIVVRWGPEVDAEGPATATEAMAGGAFTTRHGRGPTQAGDAAAGARSDADIERAIAEIRATIRPVRS